LKLFGSLISSFSSTWIICSREDGSSFSGNFSLRWFLPDDVELPNEFTDIFCGTPHWSLES
jgi:hypothetical protein